MLTLKSLDQLFWECSESAPSLPWELTGKYFPLTADHGGVRACADSDMCHYIVSAPPSVQLVLLIINIAAPSHHQPHFSINDSLLDRSPGSWSLATLTIPRVSWWWAPWAGQPTAWWTLASLRSPASVCGNSEIGDFYLSLFQELGGATVHLVENLPRQLENTTMTKSTALGLFGIPGLTAYIGLMEIGKPKVSKSNRPA